MAKTYSKSKCNKCGNLFLNSNIPLHEKRCDGKGKLNYVKKNLPRGHQKGVQAWNKGLTKETDERVKKNGLSVSITLKKQIKDGTFKVRKMGDDAMKKLSIEQSLNNRGGRCKWFEVNGVKVQGTWERDLAIHLTFLGIAWYKPKCKRDVWHYCKNKITKSYTPDLYLTSQNIFLELKGYWWGNDKEKMKLVLEQHNDKELKIIEKIQYEKLLKSQDQVEFFNNLL